MIKAKVVIPPAFGSCHITYITIALIFKRFVSETPYLIHDTTKAPYITGSGVLLVVHGLFKESTVSFTNFVAIATPFTSGAVHLTGILPP